MAILYEYMVCGLGSYCPVNTTGPQAHMCPPGTFSNGTNLEREEDCTPCLGGTYCQGYGQ